MIYLVTGNPGAGKSLYAVSTLVQGLAKDKVKGLDGKIVERRVVVDGIPGLLLPHELMHPLDDGDVIPPSKPAQFELQEDGTSLLVSPEVKPEGVWNWHEWCRPGDIIVIDEVQRHWRPRGMGSKVPKEIQALETHRHKGVDFVLITQNPMLLDQNVRRLVGRHQHIRRILGMSRAMVYDWDGCSVSMSPRSATATTYFGYPKSAYALYKSSQLHVKQKQKIPLWTVIPVIALIGGIFVVPKAFGVMAGVTSGKGVVQASAPAAGASGAVGGPSPLPGTRVGSLPPQPPASAVPVVPKPPEFAGCIVAKGRCGCFDTQGKSVEVAAGVCEDKLASTGKPAEFDDTPKPREWTIAELDTLAFSHKR